MRFLQEIPEGVVLRVRVQPRSAKCAIAGDAGDHLKIRVNAPPVKGAANEACRSFLAKQFQLAKGRIDILSGEKSREKRILLRGAQMDTIASTISEALKKSS